MKEQFIGYEQSLKLKELGFDEPCFGVFYGSDDLKLFNDCRWEERTNSKFLIFFEDRVEFCTAITWQQVFDWFRENYGYDISIKKFTPSEYSFVIEQLFREDNNYYFIDFPFSSHQEAQTECLNKLIEVVKRNK